jgi:hypothetical protein
VPKDETEEERLDRELEELLQELRLALPGVQILFAFLAGAVAAGGAAALGGLWFGLPLARKARGRGA